ncbi:hypothetical protein ACFW3D_37715 [Streptomyces sp. NPDC058864]
MNPTHEHHDTDGTDKTGLAATTDGTGTGTGHEERPESPEGTPGEPKPPAAPESAEKTTEPPAARRPAGWSRPEDGERPVTVGATGAAEKPGSPEKPAAAAPRPAQDARVPAPGAPPRVDGAVDKLQQRLQHAVGGFVDEPRHAVEEADEVLGEATERLVEELRSRRDQLRADWRAGGRNGNEDGDTERLRLALQGYRDLVDRVLHV